MPKLYTVLVRRICSIIIKVRYIIFLTNKKALIRYLYLTTSDQVSVDLLLPEPGVSDTTMLSLLSRQNHE